MTDISYAKITPVKWAVKTPRFYLTNGLKFSYVPNVPESSGAFRLLFTPPGWPDTQVVEGKVEIVRSYQWRDGVCSPAFSYLVNQQVFVTVPELIDEWLSAQLATNGEVDNFTSVQGTPCWLSLPAFWSTQLHDQLSNIEVEVVSVYGCNTLRHSRYGRHAEISDIIKK